MAIIAFVAAFALHGVDHFRRGISAVAVGEIGTGLALGNVGPHARRAPAVGGSALRHPEIV